MPKKEIKSYKANVNAYTLHCYKRKIPLIDIWNLQDIPDDIRLTIDLRNPYIATLNSWYIKRSIQKEIVEKAKKNKNWDFNF